MLAPKGISLKRHYYFTTTSKSCQVKNSHGTTKAFEKTDGNPLYEKSKMIDNVYRQAKANGDIYKISVYASKNSHEFFAETFTIYAMQEEILPRYILKMIEEVIK